MNNIDTYIEHFLLSPDIQQNKIYKIKFWLKNGAKIDDNDLFNRLIAAIKDDEELVELAIKAKVDFACYNMDHLFEIYDVPSINLVDAAIDQIEIIPRWSFANLLTHPEITTELVERAVHKCCEAAENISEALLQSYDLQFLLSTGKFNDAIIAEFVRKAEKLEQYNLQDLISCNIQDISIIKSAISKIISLENWNIDELLQLEFIDAETLFAAIKKTPALRADQFTKIIEQGLYCTEWLAEICSKAENIENQALTMLLHSDLEEEVRKIIEEKIEQQILPGDDDS